MHTTCRVARPTIVGLALALFGCQQAADDPAQLGASAPAMVPAGIPVPGKFLDKSSPGNGGILSPVGSDGLPVIGAAESDPRLAEAARFQETIQAPPDLAGWKQAHAFPVQAEGESLDAFRIRSGAVVYYNKNELGLGRELGCAEFPDGTDEQGNPRTGVACYVTNFGRNFSEQEASLAMAIEGHDARNTVCITYRPSLGAGYEVQFYVYGPEGKRQDWAQLDDMGPRPHPHVCMNCHGGSYDDKKHMAREARFLPLDPNLVVFSEGDAFPSLTRPAQEERIRVLNALALRTPLSPGQTEMVNALYAGQPTVSGQISQLDWAPAAWTADPADRQLYDKVVKPYCATCHLAMYTKQGQPLAWYALFNSRADLKRYPMHAFICGSFGMPNAQPTLEHFWRSATQPIVIGPRQYSTPGEALLAEYEVGPEACAGLPTKPAE